MTEKVSMQIQTLPNFHSYSYLSLFASDQKYHNPSHYNRIGWTNTQKGRNQNLTRRVNLYAGANGTKRNMKIKIGGGY